MACVSAIHRAEANVAVQDSILVENRHPRHFEREGRLHLSCIS